jgi:hypothetical protein
MTGIDADFHGLAPVRLMEKRVRWRRISRLPREREVADRKSWPEARL